ncbi:MAG: hypothetical protein IT201_09125 [Thermoleophilia bacterium]|nr:hypothetical protein [Thermoleophilia bacterium]
MTAAAQAPAPPRPGASGLASAKSPPFRLPGEHFAAAFVFLAAAAAGAVAVAPDLALGGYPLPRVVAVAHLFGLGWITTTIMGALYQFVPVALGEPIRSVRLGHVAFALHVPGLALFVCGLVFDASGVMLAGAATFGAGILAFAGNLALTLRRSARRDLTWWALAGADCFLLATLALGILLAGNLDAGYLAGGRLDALGTHLHVALAGWVLLVVVGVAHRLLPMFLLSHGAGSRFAKAAVALLTAGSVVLLASHGGGPAATARWLPVALLAAGLASFLAQARQFYRHRHRPALDPGLRLAAVALALLAAGLVLGLVALSTWATPRGYTSYVAALLLGLSLFVAAHAYKIVPFLVWYHRFGRLAGRRPVPRVVELYSTRAAWAAAALLAGGAVALVATVAAGQGDAARGAAALFAAGVAIQGTQMLQLARRKP